MSETPDNVVQGGFKTREVTNPNAATSITEEGLSLKGVDIFSRGSALQRRILRGLAQAASEKMDFYEEPDCEVRSIVFSLKKLGCDSTRFKMELEAIMRQAGVKKCIKDEVEGFADIGVVLRAEDHQRIMAKMQDIRPIQICQRMQC